jgi:hypothetical protein
MSHQLPHQESPPGAAKLGKGPMFVAKPSAEKGAGNVSGNAGLRRAIFIGIVLIAMLVAGVTLTLPAVHDLAGIFPQFSQLWSIAGNRVEIFWLFVKAASPLLVAVIALILYLLWSLVMGGEEAQPKHAAPAPSLGREARAPQPTFFSPQARPGAPAYTSQAPPSAPASPEYVPPAQPTGVVHISQPLPRVQRGRQRTGAAAPEAGALAKQRKRQWQQKRFEGRTPLAHSRLAEVAGGLSPRASETGGEDDEAAGDAAPLAELDIRLLGEISLVVRNLATSREMTVPMLRSGKRRELLAYVAWQRGKRIMRDKLLHDVFERELGGDEGDEPDVERLSANFNTQTKLLRRDINEVAQKLGLPRLKILDHDPDWRLLDYCRVVDLDIIDSQYSVIERAVRDGNLETPAVREACDRLIEAYHETDFLQRHVERREFEPWAQSWVRDPFTAYRDYYLAALWYRAEIERITGERLAGDGEQLSVQQRAYFERAASLYERYALYAPKTRFDKKVYGREPGVRISQSERALRRCIDMYSVTNNTQAVDHVYEEYKKLMRQVFPSGVTWKPSAETVTVLEEARAQTREHRFRGQIQPHDMGEAERDREQSPS